MRVVAVIHAMTMIRVMVGALASVKFQTTKAVIRETTFSAISIMMANHVRAMAAKDVPVILENVLTISVRILAKMACADRETECNEDNKQGKQIYNAASGQSVY